MKRCNACTVGWDDFCDCERPGPRLLSEDLTDLAREFLKTSRLDAFRLWLSSHGIELPPWAVREAELSLGEAVTELDRDEEELPSDAVFLCALPPPAANDDDDGAAPAAE